jgi:glycosyltransferase involved in cell wall biosynthesis
MRFVFFDLDTASLAVGKSGTVRKLVETLERFAARRALLHVLPGVSRLSAYPISEERVVFLPNTPLRKTVADARTLAAREGDADEDRLVVYVNGWLPAERGIDFVLRTAEILAGDDRIRFVFAGHVAAPMVDRIRALQNCRWLGKLDITSSLAQYYTSNVCLTFYDPSVPINRVAEPNKWWDCVATGTPFVTNRGIRTARYFSDRGACWLIEYGSADDLAGLLQEFASKPEEVAAKRRAVSAVGARVWDDGFTGVLARIGLVQDRDER